MFQGRYIAAALIIHDEQLRCIRKKDRYREREREDGEMRLVGLRKEMFPPLLTSQSLLLSLHLSHLLAPSN